MVVNPENQNIWTDTLLFTKSFILTECFSASWVIYVPGSFYDPNHREKADPVDLCNDVYSFYGRRNLINTFKSNKFMSLHVDLHLHDDVRCYVSSLTRSDSVLF